MDKQNKKVLISAIIVSIIAFVSFNFESITGQPVRDPIPSPEIKISSLHPDLPENNPLLVGRTKLYVAIKNVYPHQQFDIFRVDTPTDLKVGDFKVKTSSSKCDSIGSGRYACNVEELLPFHINFIDGNYYIQARARSDDPNKDYVRGELIGEKVYFKYKR